MRTVIQKKWVNGNLRLKLNTGSFVRIEWARDDATDDEGIEVFFEGRHLTSEDPEVELGDLYAPTGLPLEVMLAFREEVFQQHLRDEAHDSEERLASGRERR